MDLFHMSEIGDQCLGQRRFLRCLHMAVGAQHIQVGSKIWNLVEQIDRELKSQQLLFRIADDFVRFTGPDQQYVPG